jgi:hypothetical protein
MNDGQEGGASTVKVLTDAHHHHTAFGRSSWFTGFSFEIVHDEWY